MFYKKQRLKGDQDHNTRNKYELKKGLRLTWPKHAPKITQIPFQKLTGGTKELKLSPFVRGKRST